MKRQWETVRTGERDPMLADIFCCLADAQFVEHVLHVKALADATAGQAIIIADRHKVSPTGEVVHPSDVGSYRVTDYYFRFQAPVVEPLIDENWSFAPTGMLDRDLAPRVAAACDIEFLRAVIDIYSLLERIGGQVYLKAVHHENVPVGYVWHYEHIADLLRTRDNEPDAQWQEPAAPVDPGPATDPAATAGPVDITDES